MRFSKAAQIYETDIHLTLAPYPAFIAPKVAAIGDIQLSLASSHILCFLLS